MAAPCTVSESAMNKCINCGLGIICTAAECLRAHHGLGHCTCKPLVLLHTGLVVGRASSDGGLTQWTLFDGLPLDVLASMVTVPNAGLTLTLTIAHDGHIDLLTRLDDITLAVTRTAGGVQ